MPMPSTKTQISAIKPTVMILGFRTDRSGQTVKTQIRLLLEEQSDQGLRCLLFPLHLFDIQDLDVVLRTGRMRWFGHVERSTGWISEIRKLNVVAQKRSGRPRKSWDEVIKNDRKELDMDSADPQNRSEWRGRLRGRLVKKPNPR